MIRQLGVFFTQGLAPQLQSVRVVHQPIKNGIGERVIADAGIPLIDWKLTELTLTGLIST
jgi:hypothetical protein